MPGPIKRRPGRREQTPTPAEQAELLKERVYVTFSALAVVLALESHSEDESPGSSAATLFVTVVGALLAILVADVVSHIVVHAGIPDPAESRHMLSVSFGSLGTVAVPLLLVGLAGLDLITLSFALRLATIALLAALLVVGFLAVRRARISLWKRVLLLLAEVAVGTAVVGLQFLAKSS